MPNCKAGLFGGSYVELAVTLGVARERINTIIDFAGAQKYGAKTDGSSAARRISARLSNPTGIAVH